MANTRSASETKDIVKLVRLIKQQGFNVVPAGSGHKKVVDKHGQPVRDKNGPVIISSSPSDVRWRAMTVKRLMDANVLKKDPWDANPEASGNGRGRGLQNPAVREKARLALQRDNDRRQRQTLALREMMEPFVLSLGGWDKRGNMSGIAHTALLYLEKRGWVDRWPSETAATQSLNQVRLGNTLSERAYQAWMLFVREFDGVDDPLQKYMDIARACRGLQPAEPDEEEGVAEQQNGNRNGNGAAPNRFYDPVPAPKQFRLWIKPKLALEALYLMAGSPNADEERCMRVFDQIWELELTQKEGGGEE